jgi:CO/xanthine dehydrogenase FAD-binding subunit
MNLNTIREVKRPEKAEQISQWRDGYAWLAGGTWLFSEPQLATHTLIDLGGFNWPALVASADGLDIAGTCPIAELYAFEASPAWRAAPLLKACTDALLMSFKIQHVATVGGNICMSLPAGAMISLTCALEATYTLWPRAGAPRTVSAIDFVTGNHANILRPGELLRSMHLASSALARRAAFRRTSLTKLGRSAALVIGTRSEADDDLLLTITAATPRPVQLRFVRMPTEKELQRAIDAAIPSDGYFHDVHGSAGYKRHLTHNFAEQIRRELAQEAGA